MKTKFAVIVLCAAVLMLAAVFSFPSAFAALPLASNGKPAAEIVLAADAGAFVVIMILLLIPCLFISKVDPAETVRVK